ncbi:contractile injection system tape measure protein [Aquimarina algicola]|uniref:Uncharacterized protein n=1 Tax=Aquimarina algicola TaxID=2589995 RepID=A0A504JER9_9FLAO|nr:contractile injection system tape measure protein [Aquimarina algicola]TPN86208.1 hypothetical protein FHK87_13135 [Aquimarina algicola]
MKNPQTHIIKSQEYEITIGDASKGYVYQSRISQLQDHKVRILLQKIMDQYDTSEFLDQFESVTLDLGTVSATNFEQELLFKIEEAFSDFFKNNIHDNGSLKVGKRKQIYNKKLQQIEFFLTHGYLQWDTSFSQTPSELLMSLLQNNTKELVTLLKKQGKKEAVRKRLIHQLEDSSLEKIVVSVVGKEGEYINNYRQDITKYQDHYTLVHIAQSDFRNALWEILLTYIFIETGSYFNQKSFLKYSINKIALKYRSTYKSLLSTLKKGIAINLNTYISPSIQKVINALYEEQEQQTQSIFTELDYKSETSFFTSFMYYLQNGSLPVTSTLSSYELMYTLLNQKLSLTSDEFYTFFNEHIESDINIDRIVKLLPNQTLNLLVSKNPNRIFKRLNTILLRLFEIVNQHQLSSTTLENLKHKSGTILLYTYYNVNKGSTNAILEFLFQVIRYTAIDKGFLTILRLLENDKEVKENSSIQLFVEELKPIVSKPKKTSQSDKTAVFLEQSQQLYKSYRCKNQDTLQHYQEKLQQAKYKDEALQLVFILIDIYSKGNIRAVQDITEWVSTRTEELISKGKPVLTILAEMLKIVKDLTIDNEVYVAIQEVLIQYETTKDIKISSSTLEELIRLLKAEFYIDSQEDVYERINAILNDFSKNHNINRTLLQQHLQRELTKTNHSVVLEKIINEINNRKNNLKDTVTLQHQADIVQYFLEKGLLPWWAKNTSSKDLMRYAKEVISKFGDQFIVWFTTSKHQESIVRYMDDDTYQIFIKQIHPKLATPVLEIKDILDAIIYHEISGIKSVPSKYKKNSNHLLIKYLLANQNPVLVDTIKYLIHQIVSTVQLTANDLYILIQQKIAQQTSISDAVEQLQLWVNSQLDTLEAFDTAIEEALKDQENWKEAFTFSSSKQSMAILTSIHAKEPELLRSYLRKDTFRKKLIKKLSVKAQIEFVQLFFDPSQHSDFETIIHIFSQIQRQVTTVQYQMMWNAFMASVFLKITIDAPLTWLRKDWIHIFIQLLINTLDRQSLAKLQTSLIDTTSDPFKNVADQLQEHLKQKRDKKDFIPLDVKEEESGEPIYITNAGMVLLGPFIPMLFERLQLIDNQKFKDESCMHKAVHMLQYAITGQEKQEEQFLTLNKIICGMPIHEPVACDIVITAEEKALVESLLNAVITNWSIIGKTSIAGLRETFLCREGKIDVKENAYVLTVEQKTFDMLLDQIPWSIGMVKFSWMQKILEVIWRQ